MNSSVVIVLDPRGKIPLGGPDVIKRHDNYAKQLDSISKKLRLVVLTSSKPKSVPRNLEYLDQYVLSKPTFNSLIFAWRASRCIRGEKLAVKLFVAGDPWESFWTCLLLNKIMRSDIPIQVQVHGDIADPLWRKINLQNRIRFHLAKMFCKKATAVRAVSKNQKENLIKNLRIDKSKIKVIPVPINLDSIDLHPKKSLKRPPIIGFVGRIHKDRGINHFLELLEKLNRVSHDFNVLIIGSGKSESKFLTSVINLITPHRIKFVGQISQKELSRHWCKIGVLVSLAQVESYGLVMREALLSGVPVWALNSSGSKDLFLEKKLGQIRPINLKATPDSLFNEFNELLKTSPNPSFRNKLIKENAQLPKLLVKSWIELIKH